MSGLTQTFLQNRLTFFLTKPAFPYKKSPIGSTSGKEIALTRKRRSFNFSSMSIHAIGKSSFLKVPDLNKIIKYLDLWVWGDRDHMISVGMDGERVDGSVVGFVVLNYLLLSEVEHWNCFVDCAGQCAVSCWMESCASNGSVETVVFLDLLSFFDIPNDEFFVLSAWADHGHIVISLGWKNPVSMTWKWTFKFQVFTIPQFDSFVIACSQNRSSISEEIHRSDRSSMTVQYFSLDAASREP